MKIFVLAFIVLCLVCSIIESVNLNCKFVTDKFGALGVIEFCSNGFQYDLIQNYSNRHVDTINEDSSTNSNVKAVHIGYSNCFYLPLGLEKLFTHLEGISIRNSDFKEIKREDFKNYKNLRLLSLRNNEIKFLEPNLFDFVPKLEGIFLSNNQIAHIDAKVFNIFVGKLRYLDLSGNNCTFENAENDKSKANEIIGKVQSGSCKDETLLPATTTSATATIPATTTPLRTIIIAIAVITIFIIVSILILIKYRHNLRTSSNTNRTEANQELEMQ